MAISEINLQRTGLYQVFGESGNDNCLEWIDELKKLVCSGRMDKRRDLKIDNCGIK
jgi:hypothetical protein